MSKIGVTVSLVSQTLKIMAVSIAVPLPPQPFILIVLINKIISYLKWHWNLNHYDTFFYRGD